MKKIVSLLLVLIMMVSSVIISTTSVSAETATSGQFSYYSSVAKKSVKYSFDFDEAWFANSSVYNQNLAKLSMRLAMAVSDTTRGSIMTMFDDIGFSYTTDTVVYPAPAFNNTTNESTIGYAIGSKKLDNSVKNDCTLVIVAVRDAGLSEWADTFNIGEGGIHAGFNAAAEKVTAAVKNYISTINTTNVKILITGYSRGAAVSNITAHNINEWASTYTSHTIVKDDIFAYCFGCPKTVRKDYKGFKNDDSNIINIINENDLVSRNAPIAWGFYRFGTEYYLPTAAYSADYTSYINKQVTEYTAILSAAGVSGAATKAEKLCAGADGQLVTISEALTAIDNYFGTQHDYVVKHQSNVCKMVAEYVTTGARNKVELITVLAKGMPSFITNNSEIGMKLIEDGKDMYSIHYAENMLAWIDSISGVSDFVEPSSRKLSVACPVDVIVKDSKGNEVAKIIDEKVVEVPGSSIAASVDNEGKKTVLLPSTEKYEFILTPYGDGTMSVSIEDTNEVTEAVKVVQYNDIEIKKDEPLNAVIEEANNPSSVEEKIDLSLFNSNHEELKPDVETTGYVNPFTDVPNDSWYTNAAQWCYKNGYITGVTAYLFAPNNKLTRAMLVQILAKINGVDLEKIVYTGTFSDVKSDKWYTKSVQWAVNNGITKGTSEKMFSPDKGVTREQLATFFMAYAKYMKYDTTKTTSISLYKDASTVSSWAVNAIKWAVAEGLISGTSNTTLSPKNIATRNQTAVIIKNFIENYIANQK